MAGMDGGLMVDRCANTNPQRALHGHNRAMRKCLVDPAVYWHPTGILNNSGQPEFMDPIQICVKWIEKQEEFLDKDDNREVSKATVYVGTIICDKFESEPKLLAAIRMGFLEDLEDPSTPYLNSDTWEVRGLGSATTFNGIQKVRKVFLTERG